MPSSLISSQNKLIFVTRGLLIAVSTWFIGVVFYITLSRIKYPFELEWMEGGGLIQVLRLLEGKGIYVAPSLEYVPYIYPPFYFYFSAFISKISSFDWFFPLRLVSFLATIGISSLIFLIVKRKTNSFFFGFISVGLFYSTYKIGGAWFDIARVDMLYIFLLVAATNILDFDHWTSGIFAGILFTFAVFTKQTAIVVAMGMIIYQFISGDKKNAVFTFLTFSTCAGAWALLENVLSKGWFWYYNFSLLRLHKIPHELVYYVQPVVMIIPVIIICGLIVFQFTTVEIKKLRGKEGYWTIFTALMFCISAVASVNPGNYYNNYLPFYCSMSIMFGISMPILLEKISTQKLSIMPILIYTLCLSQFLGLIYYPFNLIPTKEDLIAGNELITKIMSIPGDVLMPNHNEMPILAGKKPFAHLIALEEIKGNFGSTELTGWGLLQAEIKFSLQSKKFGAIILDQPGEMWVGLKENYFEIRINYSTDSVFWPVTGGKTRPASIFLP